MKNILLASLLSGLSFGLLDSIWFAVFMKDFARKTLRNHIEFQNGEWVFNYTHALSAYFLMIVIAVVFLLPQIESQQSLVKTFILGVVMGICVFGIFDFTNGALFSDYPLNFILIDTAWGGLMYGLLALIFRITLK